MLSWICDSGLKNFRHITQDKLFPFLKQQKCILLYISKFVYTMFSQSENSREVENGKTIKQNEERK
jgi:hypothetical protein